MHDPPPGSDTSRQSPTWHPAGVSVDTRREQARVFIGNENLWSKRGQSRGIYKRYRIPSTWPFVSPTNEIVNSDTGKQPNGAALPCEGELSMLRSGGTPASLLSSRHLSCRSIRGPAQEEDSPVSAYCPYFPFSPYLAVSYPHETELSPKVPTLVWGSFLLFPISLSFSLSIPL